MRKDVKIIMAVCVIVLAGLIVYALFLPGEKKSAVATTENTDNTTAVTSDQTPATEPTNVATGEPSTQPSETPIALSPTTAPAETAMANAPSAPTAGAPASGDWNKLLETGSATPDAGSSISNTASSSSAFQSSHYPTPQQVAESAPMNTGGGMTSTGSSSAEEAMSTPSVNSSGQRTYTVKSGDTPSSIAQAEYGNRQLYSKILAANPKLNARHMHVGQKLILPDLSNTSAGARSSTDTGNAAANGAGTAMSSGDNTATSGTSAAGLRYTVASGDSLQHIAAKLYGSSAQWQKIYDLNKSKIGSNPARLRVGMVLQLPKAPHATAATAGSAQ
jgi:nucleoid-associated protein YgaU